jgi:hypothetical protein
LGIVGAMSETTITQSAVGLAPAAQPAPSLGARLRAHHWAPLPVVLIAPFVVVLDFFIVNVAIPSMQSRLHAGTGAVEWVVAGYGLTFAVGLIIGVVSAIASAAAGVSPSACSSSPSLPLRAASLRQRPSWSGHESARASPLPC